MAAEAIKEALGDSLLLLPFLFLTYLLMEYLEYNAMGRLTDLVGRFGKAGPFFGGIIGIVPQCGFSAAASGLFAGGVISTGSLIAVFLSTSDEMIPLFISHGYAFGSMAKIITLKVIFAVISGFLIDGARSLLKSKNNKTIHAFCESENCECENGIFKSALIHTVKIWVFVFAVNFILGLILESTGFARIEIYSSINSFLAVPIACLIGLIPNCAASVVITECYLSGVISQGALMGGLLTGSGLGAVVLFRTNKNPSENIFIILLVYALGIAWGLLIEMFGISF